MVRPNDDFTQMVDLTLPDISRYALRRAANAADAEDVVAETYAIAWRRRHELPAGPDALPWLYGVARRVLANSRRGTRRWDRLRSKVAGQRSPTPSGAAAEPDGIVERQPVLDALRRLPGADAELLRLLTWEQLTHAEAAAVLGTSENAVALRASRARRKLAGILDDRFEPLEDMDGRATTRRGDAV